MVSLLVSSHLHVSFLRVLLVPPEASENLATSIKKDMCVYDLHYYIATFCNDPHICVFSLYADS